jgi:hypothetical protein
MFLIGLPIGLAVIFRPHLIPMALFLLAYVLVVYGWRLLAVAGLGAMVGYIPQAWYNIVMFKTPLALGYVAKYDVLYEHRSFSEIINSLPFQPANLLIFVERYIGARPWLLIPVVLGAACAALVVIVLWRRSGWKAVALFVVAPLSYLGPIVLSWPFRDDVIRFSLPAIPFGIGIAVVAAVIVMSRWVPQMRLKTLKVDENSI